MGIQNKKNLEEENKKLKKSLLIAKAWMKKEVKTELSKIVRTKKSKENLKEKNEFIHENIITKNIYSFFWNFLLMNAPVSAIENIISAEKSYYNFRANPSSDWFSVISSYHKALDSIIESFIIKDFRKFARKKWKDLKRINDTLEKSLNSVINLWYIISLWRLYNLSELIIKWRELLPLTNCFKDFLEKNSFIENIILEKDFHKKFKTLIYSEIFWKKRHKWKITFVETRKARRLLIWDFIDKSCIFYKLLEIRKADI